MPVKKRNSGSPTSGSLYAPPFLPVSGFSAYEEALSLTQKGDLLYSQGKYAEALVAYDEAIVLDPYNSHEWNKKGESLFMLGKYVDAVQAFEKAVELDPLLYEGLG